MWGCIRVEYNRTLQRLHSLGSGDCVSDAFSGFREMCPCLMMYWHLRVRAGHRVTIYPQDTITVFSQVLQGMDESSGLHR